MGAPTSLLGQARAFARDFPRDKMPPGYLWDVVDYVPTIIDATLTGRGGWLWGSTAMTGDAETGIYVPFASGDKFLVQTTDGRLFEIGLTAPYTAADKGPLPRAKQNPILFVDTIVHFDKAGTMTPRLITAPGGVTTIAATNAAHKNATVGTIYKSMLVSGGAPGETDVVRFSVPGQSLTVAGSFDNNSAYHTSLPVTALQAMRSLILVFHAGAVERFRGSTPATLTNSGGDLFLETLFDRAGCVDPLAIASWNDNVVFADEHGIHITDGSVIRNLASQGGISYFWRMLYENKLTLAATTFLDYYMITVRRTDGIAVTLVCDLNKRQWFRFSNINALCYIASSTGTTMERIWAGLAGKARLARLGPCFFPILDSGLIQDDDGTIVLPSFETPWYRMGQEGLKRARFTYLSYDARVPGSTLHRDEVPGGWRYGGSDEEGIPPPVEDELAALALQQVLQVSYVRSPQDPNYLPIGTLPNTSDYARYRLPLGQNPYGVAFKVAQVMPTSVLRIFDLGVEDQAGMRSRIE